MSSPQPPTFFACADDFRAWLQAHGERSAELIVGYWKVGSGRPSLSWPESVDEALCVGWIDGVRKRIDEASYCIRFTPRRPGSIWSAVNIANAERLIAQGRMQPRGLAAFEARQARKSAVYAYEQPEMAQLTPDELARFRQNPVAWAFFENSPPSWRKPLLHWLATARKPETRERRMVRLMDACARGERFLA
jgi:uncharacterized protein YdeI (YjbR/CyaY-like superfamily)